MKQLCERLVDLLGKQKSDPLFLQFLNDIGEAPLESHPYYRFYNSGFSLTLADDGKLAAALVLIDTDSTRAGLYKPCMTLPSGITPSDRSMDIEAKLGVKPRFARKGTHGFLLSTYWLLFKFDEQTKSLNSLVIKSLGSPDSGPPIKSG